MTIQSLYDYMHTPNVIARQHFIDNFDGDALNERWNETDGTGTGIFAMDDSIEGGFKITCDSGDESTSNINFNTKRWIDQDSCFTCDVWKIPVITEIAISIGFASANGLSGDFSVARALTPTNSNYSLRTRDNTDATSESVGSIAIDVNYHCTRLKLDGTTQFMSVDNILDISKTSHYPNAKMQPMKECRTKEAVAKSLHLLYSEAFNI